MKIISSAIMLSATVLLFSCSNTKKGEKGVIEGRVELKNEKDRISYAVGVNEAEQTLNRITQGGADTVIDKAIVLKAINDHFNGKAQMSPQEGMVEIQKFVAKMGEKATADNKAKFSKNKEQGEQFLADNKQRQGVTTTLSGLQYEVLKKGSGPLIKLGDEVEVNYAGTLADGTKVDASADHGEPFKFKLEAMGGLIQGWVEGLQLMNKGAKYRLYIPYELGYGEGGRQPKVPPYSALVFEIEIVSHTPGK